MAAARVQRTAQMAQEEEQEGEDTRRYRTSVWRRVVPSPTLLALAVAAEHLAERQGALAAIVISATRHQIVLLSQARLSLLVQKAARPGLLILPGLAAGRVVTRGALVRPKTWEGMEAA